MNGGNGAVRMARKKLAKTIQFATGCEYLPRETAAELFREYDAVLAMLVDMIVNANKWTLKEKV